MRSLVYVAVQQLRRGPARGGDFGVRVANLMKKCVIMALRSIYIDLSTCDIAFVSARFMASSKPFDLVPFRGAAHVLLLTTDRMRIDKLFWRENYGTVN